MSFGQQPFGSEQPPSWMTQAPEWQAPSAAGERGASGDGPPQARMLFIVLATVLAELVIIGATANQWLSKKIADDAAGDYSFWHLFEQSWLSFHWRVSPQSGQNTAWGSELALIGVTIVVSTLLVWVLVRGAVTFWRAFFGAWLAVLAAALLGAVVRGLIDTSGFGAIGTPTGPGRVTKAIYGPLGPSQLVVVGGFVLGLVTALIVGAVAVLTRRRAAAPAVAAAEAPSYAAPEQPPPYYGEHPSGAPAAPPGAPWQDQHFEPRGRHSAGPPPGAAASDQATTAYQPVAGDQPTPFYQPAPPPTYQGGGYRPAGEPTTQFPRPPDDEGAHQ
jgi:hypothetical protein